SNIGKDFCFRPIYFAIRTLTSSTRPLATEIPGTTHSPQEHFEPCQAYVPTFDLHFGHSNFPDRLPCDNSDSIHRRGSRKWCAHGAGRPFCCTSLRLGSWVTNALEFARARL